jgi:hypothetical protein
VSQVSRHQLGLVLVLTTVVAVLVFLSWPGVVTGGAPSPGSASPSVRTSQQGQAGPAQPRQSTAPPTSTPPATVSSRPLVTGRWPGPGSAGVRAGGTSIAWTGGTSGLDSSSGRTYDRVSVPAPASPSWTFTGNNLTFRDCRFTVGVVFTGDHIRLEHCDLTGGVTVRGSAHVDLVGNDIHGWDAAILVSADKNKVSDVSITDNWLHAPVATCGGHADGIRLLGVDGIVITNNTVDLGPWVTCGALGNAIAVEPTQGTDLNMTITNNLLNGGAYTVRFAGCTKTTFEGNHFGPDAHSGPVDTPAFPVCFTKWLGNVTDGTNKPVNGRP